MPLSEEMTARLLTVMSANTIVLGILAESQKDSGNKQSLEQMAAAQGTLIADALEDLSKGK